MKTNTSRPGRVRRLAIFASVLTVAGGLAAVNLAWAAHPEPSLSGSRFEIDANANLKVDDLLEDPPSIDWASVTEMRKPDVGTGSNDDSYGGGAKEDDPCPSVGTGSIPNNKSDLLTFGTYQEPGVGSHPGFLHLFWTRVAEPSGTTLMDFELNQSSTLCANGVNPVRQENDILLEYRLVQGGTSAELRSRIWNGTTWGPATNITGAFATGTSNSSPIPVADSDGLATVNPLATHTFGEASLDLSFIFQSDQCTSFGGAFLKSRSSDSFTSQMKDFIKPVNINLTNCGKVIVRKVTNPAQSPATTEFTFNKTFSTSPATADSFKLKHGENATFANVLFGSGKTVTEVVPTGWNFDSVNCSASTGVSLSINGAVVTFALDNSTDILDCTYTNVPEKGAVRITKTRKHAASGPGDHPHAGVAFEITGGPMAADQKITTGVTDANGVVCVAGLDLSNTNYVVKELVPAGYADQATKNALVTTEGTCTTPSATVTFANTPLTTITVAVDSLVPGGTKSTISCKGPDPAETVVASADIAATPTANGDGSAVTGALAPGTYICTVVVDP